MGFTAVKEPASATIYPITALTAFQSGGARSETGGAVQSNGNGENAPISPYRWRQVAWGKVAQLDKTAKAATGLYKLGIALGATSNLKEIIQTLNNETRELPGASNMVVAIYDERADRLDFVLVRYQGRRFKPFTLKRPSRPTVTGQVLVKQKPVLVDNLAASNDSFEIEPGQKIRAWLGVPLLNPALPDDQTQGVIAIWSDKPRAYGRREIELFSAIAAQAANAIYQARLAQINQQQIRKLALENSRLHERLLTERDRVIEAGEQARRELARDLHDGPTQLVSQIVMDLEFCQKALEKEPALLPEALPALQEKGKSAMRQMRTLIFELRPLILETEGLAPALRVFVERRQQEVEPTRLTLKIETNKAGGQLSRQEAQVEAAIFAVAQEAVNNALKHARAENITVILKETSQAIYTHITDDGRGFDADKVLSNYGQRGSLGLVNMRERAELVGGELTIDSRPGRGTYITIYLPKAKAERMEKRMTSGRLSLSQAIKNNKAQ